MIIDDKLKWVDQIDSISKKASRGIGAIKLIKPYDPKECLTPVYNAVVIGQQYLLPEIIGKFVPKMS